MNKNAIRRRRRGSGGSLSGVLFSASEPGFTFEPWDITTLYQDRAGTTPVTAAGQSVGLRLDKSQGLRIGPELVNDGTFSGGSVPAEWASVGGTGSVSNGRFNVTASGGAYTGMDYSLSSTTQQGKTYVLEATLVSGTARINFWDGVSPGGIPNIDYVGPQTFRVIYTRQNAALFSVRLRTASNGATSVWDNISVRELPGNHQVAVSDAKRGVYGWMPKTGRRNLLNATDTLSTQSVTVTAVAHTLAFTGTGTVTLSGVSTAGPLVGTGAGNRVTLTFTPTAGSLTLTVSGSVTLAQLELGSTATAYQRVVSQYDITEAGVPTCYYVQADGVDDAYVTPTITPGTDKAQVFAGMRKLSDATTGILVETSSQAFTSNGSFVVGAPDTGATYSFGSMGSLFNLAVSPANYAAPTTNVLTGIGDISGDVARLRINGSQVAQVSTDQGTGNYLAYSAYIYSRGGTSLPFNGLDFGHAVRFGPNLDAATIARVERLIARNTPEVTL